MTKTHSTHNQRRTAVIASEKVTSSFPGQNTVRCCRYFLGNWVYSNATTVYKPNKHGTARSTVSSVQPRVVSKPRYARISWKVVSRFQRPVYVSITAAALQVRSVVKKYSSRW